MSDEPLSQPPISPPKPLAELTATYIDPAFLTKLKTLETTHSKYRATKPDGNCMYASLGAQWFRSRTKEGREKVEEKDEDGKEKSELGWKDTKHWKE